MSVLILQKNRVTATVKVVGTGSQTITLASLAMGDETLSTPNVTIHELFFSTNPANKITITRNSVDALVLSGTEHWSFNGLSIAENATSDIVVTMTDTAATLILVVRKVGGYSFVSPQTTGYNP